VCWHYDHTSGENVKGINLLTTFYFTQNRVQPLKVPVAFDIISKYSYCDIKSQKVQHKNPETKNTGLWQILYRTAGQRSYGLLKLH
jgi:hypothetical protein